MFGCLEVDLKSITNNFCVLLDNYKTRYRDTALNSSSVIIKIIIAIIMKCFH